MTNDIYDKYSWDIDIKDRICHFEPVALITKHNSELLKAIAEERQKVLEEVCEHLEDLKEVLGHYTIGHHTIMIDGLKQHLIEDHQNQLKERGEKII